jgi:hypothetical protein
VTVNEFIKNMASQGFTGKFRATNGEHTFVGTINPDGSISKVRVQSAEESRAKIKEMFDDKRRKGSL